VNRQDLPPLSGTGGKKRQSAVYRFERRLMSPKKILNFFGDEIMYKLQYLMDLLKGSATGDTEMAERVRQLSVACSRFISTSAAQ
jgi:hypothetical protein